MNIDAHPPVPGSLVLRFLAAPTDVATLGGTAVQGGHVLEWIDKAAYACAVGWCATYCVTAYVGNVHFASPIRSGDLVEVHAQLVLTGRTSMHIAVEVRAASLRTGEYRTTTSCLLIFVAVGEDGKPVRVRPWTPTTESACRAAEEATRRMPVRKAIEEAMAEQTYTADGTGPTAVLRFLAAPTDVNWGGKTHGGTVMRWIDEAAWACAVRWSGMECLPAFSGGVRFYRPMPIGSLVEVDARLLHTGRTSMHISVHVRSADPRFGDFQLTTHCLTVFVSLVEGRPAPTRAWVPTSPEDRRLDAHAVHLMALRAG